MRHFHSRHELEAARRRLDFHRREQAPSSKAFCESWRARLRGFIYLRTQAGMYTFYAQLHVRGAFGRYFLCRIDDAMRTSQYQCTKRATSTSRAATRIRR